MKLMVIVNVMINAHLQNVSLLNLERITINVLIPVLMNFHIIMIMNIMITIFIYLAQIITSAKNTLKKESVTMVVMKLLNIFKILFVYLIVMEIKDINI